MRDAVAERQVEGFRERLVKFIADPKGQAESLREEVKAVCWARGRQVEAHFTDGTTLTGEASAQRRRLTDPENTRRHGPYGPHRRCGSAVIAGQ